MMKQVTGGSIMFAQTFGYTTLGLNGIFITVEVDIANGLSL